MATRKVQFYAGPLEKDLDDRTLNTEAYSSSAIAQRDLQRYYILMRRSLPRFTLDEARLLVNALNVSGVYAASGNPPSWPVDRAPIWAHVTEAIEQADESKRRIRESHLKLATSFGVDPTDNPNALPDPTFGVDTDALIARLRTLTPCQEMAVLDAVERLQYTETVEPLWDYDENGERVESGQFEVLTSLADEELVRVGLAYTDQDTAAREKAGTGR